MGEHGPHFTLVGSAEQDSITSIRAKDLVSGLRRRPAGFYAIVVVDGKITKTSNKPVVAGKDMVYWDEKICLPKKRSSIISVKVYAYFEIEPTLTLLHQFRTTVGDTLDGRGELRPIDLLDNRYVTQTSSSLRITTERRIWDANELTAGRELSEPDQIPELSDTGYRDLLRYRQFHDRQDLDEAITCFERVREICPASQLHQSTASFNLATARFINCQDNNNYHDLHVPIGLYQDSFRFPNHSRSGHCHVVALDLLFALLSRFIAQADGTRVKDMFSTVTVTYAYRAAWLALQMVGITVPVQSVKSGISGAKLVNPVEGLIQAVRADLREMSYQDPRRPAALASLRMLLFRRFEALPDCVEDHEAISMLEQSVQVQVPDRSVQIPVLGILGTSLYRRFERLGDVADLNKSISTRQVAVNLIPNGHPDRPVILCQLGSLLCHRFRRLGDIGDIEKSISMHEEALRLIPSGHTEQAVLWIGLGTSLTHRFERCCDVTDINRSISMTEEAICHRSNGHPDKADWLDRLGNSYLYRFHHLSNLADLSTSISKFEEAVKLTPDGDPHKSLRLNNLGNALFLRFQHLGDLADIDRSIRMSEEAVRLVPDGHAEKPTYLNILGNSLMCRSQSSGDHSDITKLVSAQEEAVRLTRDDHPDKAIRLSTFGNSLYHRFEHLGDLADIDRSILMHEAAVCLTPDDHPKRASLLNILGHSLSRRFQLLGDVADINKSISAFEESNYLTPYNQPQKPDVLNSLGTLLMSRFRRLGDPDDINRSIVIFWESISLTPEGHPDKTDRRNELLRTTYELLSAPVLNFPAAASRSTPTSHPSRIFRVACQWVSSSRPQGSSKDFLDTCTGAIDLLRLMASDGLPLRARHRVIEAVDIARDAAAVAVDASFPEMAVELLEKGRFICWSQFLQLRLPVDVLRCKYPSLADELQKTSLALEDANCDDNITFHELVNEMVDDMSSLQQEFQRHHDLFSGRQKLLDEIRSLPGFDQFLLPKKMNIEQLAALAHSGPVVYLNASEQRCDALIVRAELGTVVPVPLPGIDCQDMSAFQGLLRLSLERDRLVISRNDISALIPAENGPSPHSFLNSLLTEGDVEGIARAARVKPQQIGGYTPEDLFKRILASLWTNAVKPVLDALGFSAPQSDIAKMDRIFWCPTGPFAFLPIHAAGLYDTEEAGEKLSDFAISSYIPSLGALASSAQKDPSVLSSNIHLVAVPQPASDGQSVLSYVEQEMDHIKSLSAKSPFVTFQESDGRVEDVMEKMRNANWVHFACHGVQDPHDPLSSGLCLADSRRLKLSDIIQLSRPQGGLAFLSACQTAQGEEMLSEESVHLAAGMLLAGYGGVIATMWAIGDSDAPKVAKGVYEHLFRDGKVPDCTEAAKALHYAVQRLRDSGASFTSWVPFIHVGR